MTPPALAADLEDKHKALVNAQLNMHFGESIHATRLWQDAVAVMNRAFLDNFPTILTALRESGEAMKERAAKAADARSAMWLEELAKYPDGQGNTAFNKSREAAEIAAAIRALKPEPSR